MEYMIGPPKYNWPVVDVQLKMEVVCADVPIYPEIALDLCMKYIQTMDPLWSIPKSLSTRILGGIHYHLEASSTAPLILWLCPPHRRK